MTNTILWYFIAVNLLTLVVSVADKGFAVYDKRRVPERVLLSLAFAGGAAGSKLAQIVCGHKRLKTDYCASLSLIAFLQLGAAAAIWSETVRDEASSFYRSALLALVGYDEAEDEPTMPRRFGPGS